jgi:nucleotide-binding universal stress UspA family protein
MFDKVLIGVDGRSGGRDAIALARQLASEKARLVLACVYREASASGFGAGLGGVVEDRLRAQELLTAQRQVTGLEAETVVCLDGSPGRGLHQLAEHDHADLLVVGSSHRSALGRLLLGDDTRGALNGAPCAVAIAPRGYAEASAQWTTIGVGDDGSVEGDLAREAARVLAGRHHATVRLLSVVALQSARACEDEPSDWTDATVEMVKRERQRVGQIEGVVGDVVYGDAPAELARFAGQVDVLIVGSRGYGPLGRLVTGSTSTYLARHSPRPLLVMPRCLSERGQRSSDAPSPGPRMLAAPAS